MIIVDFNAVCIANMFAALGNHTNAEVDLDMLRHMVLNSLRHYRTKFTGSHGELVIACDGIKNWRREIYPYYKANRKKSRDESELNWPQIFEHLNTIREELTETFPYRVVHVDEAEADDVIGTLCKELGNFEPIMIISGDKDFRQLQCYLKVRQYDPVRNRYIEENDPVRYLKEHIIRGDGGDGVCNIKSPANSLVLGKRQKSIFQKDVDQWVNMQPEQYCDAAMLERYRQNEAVIDLAMIPDDVTKKILTTYGSQEGKGRSGLFDYFVKHRLRNLMEDIGQF